MTHGVLVVDKPLGRSSHDVVALVRRALGTRRVGHAGTLDPLATGVLVLAIGEALKIVRYLALDDKAYDAVVALGEETDTLDADGAVLRRAPLPSGLSLELVREAALGFVGEITQRVPAVSAIKQGGQPLYRRARRGEALVPPERTTRVDSLEVSDLTEHRIRLRVECGKGFYVRALARDLAAALGTVGHLAELRRTRSGPFQLSQCAAFESVVAAAEGDMSARDRLMQAMLPLERALPDVPRIVLDAEGAAHARHGRPIAFAHAQSTGAWTSAPTEPLLLCDDRGQLLALGKSAEGALCVVRGLGHGRILGSGA
ncbi:MAG: tRNA pseudouridine(55) synthase TruB [Polyangiales bacterium]